jgi:hypothetical protein
MFQISVIWGCDYEAGLRCCAGVQSETLSDKTSVGCGIRKLGKSGFNNRSVNVINSSYVVPSSPILSTLMMEGMRYSEILVLTRAIHQIPENCILL